MKNILIIVTLLTFMFSKGQIVNIPDANFKNALLNHNPIIDTNNDGEIQVTEANGFNEGIDVHSKSISDLTGIEVFTNINSLNCRSNSLQNLNLINNNLLVYINCRSNRLTELIINTNSPLEELYCSNNKLNSLDLSFYQNLRKLRCINNNLLFLNIKNGNNSELSYPEFQNNEFCYIIVDDSDANYISDNGWKKHGYVSYVESITEGEALDCGNCEQLHLQIDPFSNCDTGVKWELHPPDYHYEIVSHDDNDGNITDLEFNPNTSNNITSYYSFFLHGDFYDDRYIYVRKVCEDGSYSQWDSMRYPEHIDLPCYPTNASSINTVSSTQTSITLEWENSPFADGYIVSYGITPYVQNSGGLNQFTGSNTITINNLIPNISYDFYISSICPCDSSSDWSSSFTATTDCSNCTSFIPEENREYIIDAWAKEDHTSVTTVTTEANRDDIELMLNDLISNYDPNNPLSNTYVNQGLQNLINSGSINQNIVNPTIYNFNYDVINNQFQFQFGDGLHVQTFDAGCIVIVGNPPSFGQIVDVTPNANNDPNIFTLGVDCDGDGIKEYLKNYEFGLDTYMANVTTITNEQVMTYSNVYVQLTFLDNADSIIPDFTGEPNRKYYPNLTGDIIDGWQRIHGIFKVPVGTIKIKIELVNDHVNDAYFDDVRIFPVNGNMKSFVYDQQTQRLMAELDENNYATFYEYDKEGGLIRVKKETEKGVFTIQETRSGNVKKD